MRSPFFSAIATFSVCSAVLFGLAGPAVAASEPMSESEISPSHDATAETAAGDSEVPPQAPEPAADHPAADTQPDDPAAAGAPEAPAPKTSGPDSGGAAETAATAAPRSTVDLAIEVSTDGTGPFTPTDGPGADASATNGVVRTLDAITYRATVNSNAGDSSNERFTLTAPAGTAWAGVPATCSGPGSAIVGQDLTCNLGTVPEGQAVAVPAVLNVTTDLVDGDPITVSGTVTADNAENGSVSATSPTTTVSSAARYNLSKSVHNSVMRTGVAGPDGTLGIQLIYPIAVSWDPVVAGQGLLGFEASAGPMTFTDDVSKLLGDLPSEARLWNGQSPACGPNRNNDWRLGALPGGAGGGPQNVADSGSFSCVQDAPGSDIDVTISGTVTDPNRLPTQNLTGGPISGGVKAYVVSGYISIWMPTPPSGTSVTSTNTFTALQTTAQGGTPNYPGETEPLSDNRAQRSLVELAPGRSSKRLWRVVDKRGMVSEGSARAGDPWTTAGSHHRSDVVAWNNGLSPFSGATLCDTFDRRTQRLAKVNGTYGWLSGFSGGRMQFAAYDMTSPMEGQRSATCEDGDGPWYDSPEAVPGGVDAVGAIRAIGDIPGGATAGLYTLVQIKTAANATRAYDFGHVQFGDRQPGWVHDLESDPELGAGGLSDSVLITENLARVGKKIVDPGSDAAGTPDQTSFVVAGTTVDYALYPSLTNSNATAAASEVVVQDVLPRYTSYVPGSASKAPVVDTVVGDDGSELQRLTWTLPDVEPNSIIEPLTYTVAVSGLAPAAPIANTVTVASPSDLSPVSSRTAQRNVQIVTTGGVGVEKSAVAPVVVVGDRLEWELGYTNTDAAPLAATDLIDVLPSPEHASASEFHGTATLAEPLAVDPATGETALYTAADPDSISLDGADPSNQPGGTTRWCDEGAFGSEGCPATLAEVTAVRIQRSMPVPVGEQVVHRLAMTTDGAVDGDRYVNRFGLRSSNLALPVQSNEATIRVVAGSIGDRVWNDLNGDGLQDADERGIADVPVQLTGTDDLGAVVERSMITDADGTYVFDGLRPGRYTVSFTAPDGRVFTKELVGDDRSVDSDVDADGVAGPVDLAVTSTVEGALDGVERIDTVDAGLLTAVVPPVDPPVDPSEPGAPADGAGDVPTPTVSTAPATAGGLARTGTEAMSLVSGALALLFLGAVIVLARRRPEETTDSR